MVGDSGLDHKFLISVFEGTDSLSWQTRMCISDDIEGYCLLVIVNSLGSTRHPSFPLWDGGVVASEVGMSPLLWPRSLYIAGTQRS